MDSNARQVGYPKTISADYARAFTSRDMDVWAYQRNNTLGFSRPGKPTDSAYVEAFNGKFRLEYLNAPWLMGFEGTAETLEVWYRDHNKERPHSAIGSKVPASLIRLPEASSPFV